MAQINHKLENLSKMVLALERAIKELEIAKQEQIEFIQGSVVARFKILVESSLEEHRLSLKFAGLFRSTSLS